MVYHEINKGGREGGGERLPRSTIQFQLTPPFCRVPLFILSLSLSRSLSLSPASFSLSLSTSHFYTSPLTSLSKHDLSLCFKRSCFSTFSTPTIPLIPLFSLSPCHFPPLFLPMSFSLIHGAVVCVIWPSVGDSEPHLFTAS